MRYPWLLILAACAHTPYPRDDAVLRREARALDAARRLGPLEFERVTSESIERLDDFYNDNADNTRGAWAIIYLAHWYLLRGERLHDPAERKQAGQYFQTLIDSLQSDDEASRRIVQPILDEARAGKKRAED